MLIRPLQLLFVLATLALTGCASQSMHPPENAYANMTEAMVRAQLGEPHLEFAGHYGDPPLTFTQTFSGEIKTLVFKKPGGEYYVSFEKQPSGWVSICSSWLYEGARF